MIVEGQADAVTFGEWGIAVVAIGGMQATDELLERLKAHSRLFIALDNTDEANAKSHEIARQLRGETYLPGLPNGVKDANDWLAHHHATDEDAQAMLNRAEHWLAAKSHVPLTSMAWRGRTLFVISSSTPPGWTPSAWHRSKLEWQPSV